MSKQLTPGSDREEERTGDPNKRGVVSFEAPDFVPSYHPKRSRSARSRSRTYARSSPLTTHPKAGASWEGFGIEQVITSRRVREAYFWSTHQGAEHDLLVMHRGKRYGFEMKLADAPDMTKSMLIALADLKLDQLFVVYPGKSPYPIGDKIQVVSIGDLPAWLSALD